MVTITVWLVTSTVLTGVVYLVTTLLLSQCGMHLCRSYGLPYIHLFLQLFVTLTPLFTKNMANLRNHTNCEGVLLKSA